MKKALVVAPNAGVSFGSGGGAYVAMKIVETLARSRDSSIGIMSLLGADPGRLVASTGISVRPEKIRSFSLFQDGGKEPSLGFLVSPYSAAILLHLTRLVRRTIESFNPDLIIFNDDAPQLPERLYHNRRSMLYAHFPYACRLAFGNPDAPSGKVRRVTEAFTKPFLRHVIETRKAHADWLIANSSVTQRYMRSTFRRDDVTVLNPPIDFVGSEFSVKSDLIVSVGAIQPNKRYEDVVRAAALSTSPSQWVIIGQLRDLTYHRKILSLIKGSHLENRVTLRTGLPRRELLRLLARSKVIVHTAQFEPFGVSVLEGMSMGAVPVVFAGGNSGPWTDIVQKGEYGMGFCNVDELAKTVDSLISDRRLWLEYSRRAVFRSKNFSSEEFSRNLVSIIGKGPKAQDWS